jgi:hypothetical protein
MQEILILLIFLAAVVYLVRMFWRQANSNEKSCAKGCGGCSTINPEQLEKQIRAAQKR